MLNSIKQTEFSEQKKIQKILINKTIWISNISHSLKSYGTQAF